MAILDDFKAMAPAAAQEFFVNLPARDQAELLFALPESDRRLWMRMLDPDDAADLVQCVARERRVELLDMLDRLTRNEVTALMAYGEDVAGGLMSPRYARVRPEMTAEEAISYVRRQSTRALETIYYTYVLDGDQKLLGVVSFREFFAAQPDERVSEFMTTDPIVVHEQMHQEEVSRLFAKHSLIAIPVVTSEGRMKGIVTLDDIVDVVQEEATADIHKLGGSEALDEPYMKISLWKMIQKRGGWLVMLFLGEMLTASAMGYFENEIAKAVVLALFVPLIISSGGNSGSQASTLVIRAMALGEVRLADWWRVMRRELVTGLCLGLILGTVGVVRIMLWQSAFHTYGEHYLLVAATVGMSLVAIVLWGGLAGSILPFIMRRLGFDPATACTPFVATFVDVTGLIIYFTVASFVLSGTLL